MLGSSLSSHSREASSPPRDLMWDIHVHVSRARCVYFPLLEIFSSLYSFELPSSVLSCEPEGFPLAFLIGQAYKQWTSSVLDAQVEVASMVEFWEELFSLAWDSRLLNVSSHGRRLLHCFGTNWNVRCLLSPQWGSGDQAAFPASPEDACLGLRSASPGSGSPAPPTPGVLPSQEGSGGREGSALATGHHRARGRSFPLCSQLPLTQMSPCPLWKCRNA